MRTSPLSLVLVVKHSHGLRRATPTTIRLLADDRGAEMLWVRQRQLIQCLCDSREHVYEDKKHTGGRTRVLKVVPPSDDSPHSLQNVSLPLDTGTSDGESSHLHHQTLKHTHTRPAGHQHRFTQTHFLCFMQTEPLSRISLERAECDSTTSKHHQLQLHVTEALSANT